jgi:mRNA-degrading endonuclease RelE of RelBE toxin-antitoxin system
MFNYNLTDELSKKLEVLCKKDKVLAETFKKKLLEIINRDKVGINAYKNLKSPLNEFKRIHLTSNYILLFAVDIKNNHVVFVDIMHRDKVYSS